jgi:hypothetical protein
MTATNHALTGALVGFIIGQPAIALPVAFASHYVCDALPHFGLDDEALLRTRLFRNYLIFEASLCVTLVLVLAIMRPEHWFLAAVCAFLATSPDLFWINHYVKERAGKVWRPGWHSKFAGGIQWFERPIGAATEAAWFIGAIILLVPFLAQ